MNNYNKETDFLKELIKQVDNTGLSAWIAGERLFNVKEKGIYKEKYNNFKNYCKQEFNISESTSYTYIKIYKNYEKNSVNGIFISHLRTIADIVSSPEKRYALIKTVSNFSGDINNEDIVTIASIAESESLKNSKDIERESRLILIENNIERKRKIENRKKLINFGKPLNSEFIPNIRLDKEPINEMGVVALFCLIFEYFSNYFTLNNEKIAFKKIKYVQAPFPDLNIICSVKNSKKTETEILVEFEFQSFEYIRHKHHLAKNSESCLLIICWEDNAKTHNTRKKLKAVQEMPPILELKSFLETGEVKLIK